ncbi:MAG: HIT family protein [Defluviitaleaceae bacterium]|nr:HIT family protein [Defluviitaleaceae bacterium]
MLNDCIFCKIIAGDIPSHKVYEDERLLAILDVFPTTRGHVLILPKAHARDFFDLPAETAAAILPVAQALAGRIRAAFQPDGLNVIQNNGAAAGQSVFHYHMHLIPRWEGDDAVRQGKPMTVTAEDLAEFAAMIQLKNIE